MAKTVATPAAPGMMSAADKQSLDALNAAIAPDAEGQTLDLNGYTLTGGDMRYGESGTVSAAIAANTALVTALRSDVETDAEDTQVHVYTHTRSDAGVHELTGSGSNGRVKLTAQLEEDDSFTVNGDAVTALSDGVLCTSLPVGVWLTFVYDAEDATVNFKCGTSGATDESLPVCILVQGELPATPGVSDNSRTREIYAALVPATMMGGSTTPGETVTSTVRLGDVDGPYLNTNANLSVGVTAINSHGVSTAGMHYFVQALLKNSYTVYMDGVRAVRQSLTAAKLYRTMITISGISTAEQTSNIVLPLYRWVTTGTPHWALV